ncbi:MAG: hypothetical protein ACLPX5_14860 [Dissulfurispiraceae bacterium]
MNDKSEGTRIPEEVNGFQVNFCKNPRCPNFGIPASTEDSHERNSDGKTEDETIDGGKK